MANVDVVSEIVINRSRERVAAFAGDPDNAPVWYVNIEAVEWQTSPPAVIGSQIAFMAHFMGRQLKYTYEIVELVPDERLVMRTAQGPFPMETTYTWEAIDESTTRMTLRNRGRPAGFSALITQLTTSIMRRANGSDLARLKQILESEAT